LTLDDLPQESTFTELDGIDTEIGLAICAGNPTLYRKMLSRFREHHSHFSQEFHSAQQSGDPDANTRVAHTIKAGLMMIGATSAQQAAHRLEILCSNGMSAEEIASALEEVEIALDPVINGLDRYFSDSSKK